MRIGYLVSRYPAPSHTFIRREVEALRRRGLEIHTFSIRPPEDATGDDGVTRGGTWVLLPVHPARLVGAHGRMLLRRPGAYLHTLGRALAHRVPGARALLWSLFHFAEAVVLAEELERRGIEHLHNHFANAGANVGYLATRLLGIQWSLTLHGISEFDYPAGPLLPEKVAAAQFVACASYFGRAQAMRVTPPSQWAKLHVVRCGVSLENLPRWRPPAAGGPLRILVVGRLAPEKGHVGLVRAFSEAVAQGLDATLRIGGAGPGRDDVQDAVRACGLGDRVRLLGRLRERQVLEEMARADAFVLPSFMEGLPVVLMEALALGVPVVAPRVAGVPELVEHGRTGLLFTPGHFAELADRILQLAADPALRRRLGHRGRRRVRACFDVERAVEPLVHLYGAGAEEILHGADAIGEMRQLLRHTDQDERVAAASPEPGAGPQ